MISGCHDSTGQCIRSLVEEIAGIDGSVTRVDLVGIVLGIQRKDLLVDALPFSLAVTSA